MRNYSNVLLDPSDVAICLIDHEPQMFFGVGSCCKEIIINSVVGLAKTAKIFDIPLILSTVTAKTFSGPMVKKIQDLFPDTNPIDRTSLNAWEDENFKSAVEKTGKKKLLIAGLWTEVCVALPTLSAIEDGYKVYVIIDACGGVSKQAHKAAITRMVASGAKPITWLAAMLEMQRDWSNKETYDSIMQVVQQHGGNYGLGVEYAESMIGK
ncbi:MAG: hydrolase [Candidatus Improbicoccus devescovinae]|nr:MAG: hydrolase [Candidatus Improbicoccus devescovinae]